ncbi:MAG: M28 family metallopeptidase [Candidatus Hodarchaeota archaeon]
MSTQDKESNKLKENTTEKNLNVDNVYRITERLAFPRLTGSEGEKKAIKILLDEFRKAGYNSITQQKFKTSFYNWIFSRYIFSILGIGLILLALSLYISPIITLGIFIIGIYISFRALGVSTSTKIKLSKNPKNNFETENVFVNLKSKNSTCKVIFLGHWDSKSQTFPPSTRIIIFAIFVFSSLILYLLYFILSLLKLIINFNSPILNNVLLDNCIIIAIIGAINYFNKTGNNSPGALDNAAAVGVLIELGKYYKRNPVKNVDLTFLSTGSEELNLGGATHFIQSYKDKLDKNSTFFINLDFIGGSELIRLISSYGIPRKISSKKLNKLFLESAKELKVKIKDIYAPTGVWSDYMPIVQEGFEACWLGSQPGLKFVHTKNDNMNLISKEGIEDILNLCVSVIEKLDNEYD